MSASMRVPLLDLKREYEAIRDELAAAWAEVFERMHLSRGAHLSAFER